MGSRACAAEEPSFRESRGRCFRPARAQAGRSSLPRALGRRSPSPCSRRLLPAGLARLPGSVAPGRRHRGEGEIRAATRCSPLRPARDPAAPPHGGALGAGGQLVVNGRLPRATRTASSASSTSSSSTSSPTRTLWISLGPHRDHLQGPQPLARSSPSSRRAFTRSSTSTCST